MKGCSKVQIAQSQGMFAKQPEAFSLLGLLEGQACSRESADTQHTEHLSYKTIVMKETECQLLSDVKTRGDLPDCGVASICGEHDDGRQA